MTSPSSPSGIEVTTVGDSDEEWEIQSPKSQAHLKNSAMMSAFSEELDQLTRTLHGESLEDLLTRAKQRTIAEPRTPLRTPNRAARLAPEPRRSETAPLDESHGHQQYFGTPQSVTRHSRMQASPGAPSPMQTPAYRMFSPSPAIFEEQFQKKSPVRKEEATARSSDSPTLERERLAIKALLEKMDDTLERQQAQMRLLQQENLDLRAHVAFLESQERASYGMSHAQQPTRALSYAEDFPYAHPYSHPRPNRRDSSRHESVSCENCRPIFSPGTKFVAELSQVMSLDVGMHAPLSLILDKHMDQVSRIRKQNGWDR